MGLTAAVFGLKGGLLLTALCWLLLLALYLEEVRSPATLGFLEEIRSPVMLDLLKGTLDNFRCSPT